MVSVNVSEWKCKHKYDTMDHHPYFQLSLIKKYSISIEKYESKTEIIFMWGCNYTL